MSIEVSEGWVGRAQPRGDAATSVREGADSLPRETSSMLLNRYAACSIPLFFALVKKFKST